MIYNVYTQQLKHKNCCYFQIWLKNEVHMIHKRIDMLRVFWVILMTIGGLCISAGPAKSEPQKGSSETMTGQNAQTHHHIVQQIHAEYYEKLRHSPKIQKAISAFGASPGAQRTEAATTLLGFLQKGASLASVENLLDQPDELPQKDLWRYQLHPSQWLEITFDQQDKIADVTILVKKAQKVETSLYQKMSSKKIISTWGEPQKRQQHGEQEIWFYRFDKEGLWKFLIHQNTLVSMAYITIPINLSPLANETALSLEKLQQQHISDIEVAISEFKTQPGYRAEAAKTLKPLIHTGMTSDDVEAFLGAPDTINDMNKLEQEGMSWGYIVFYSEYVNVQFDAEGRVVGIFP